jgi:hypothetical protein
MDKIDKRDKRFPLAIFPYPQIPHGESSFRANGRSFDHHKGRTALRARTEMNKVPGCHIPFPGLILAHRREENAMGKCDGSKRNWTKKLRHRIHLGSDPSNTSMIKGRMWAISQSILPALKP